MDPNDTTIDDIGKYIRLDLRAFREQLMAGAEHEAEVDKLQLSAAHDKSAPASGLSPYVVSWFNTHIAPLRIGALSQLNTRARAIKLEGGSTGIIEPMELAQAERRRTTALAEATERFERENSMLIGDYMRLNDTYLRYRNNENREAKIPSLWQMLAIWLVVLIPESVLNYESFRMAPFIQSAFMATGITIIVGIAIAIAGHSVGVFIRRFNYYRRGDDRIREASGTPMFWLGIGLLVVALATVAVARYYYLVPKVAEAIALGNMPPNIYFSVASLLFGNLICFLIGVIMAFAMHDPNPEYEAAAKNCHATKKQLAKLRRAQLDNTVKEINRRLESDRNDAAKKGLVMQGKPGYSDLLQCFDAIRAKDNEVVAMLQEYRNQLVKKFKHGVSLSMKDYSADPMNTLRHIEVKEFTNYPIHLHMAST